MNRFLPLFLSLFCWASMTAQEISYGFEVGLNFSQFSGPSETNDAGDNLETFKMSSGFHVGANLRLKLVDRFGVKAEVLFSQKGGKNIYDGEGIQIFRDAAGMPIFTIGERRTVVSVTNSYIDIPITGYYRPVERIELFAGANVAFLVSSTGIGEFTYAGKTGINGDPIEFLAELDQNYSNDLGRTETTVDEFEELITVEIDGEEISFPQSLGAYYLDFETKGDKNFYNPLDIGLVGGAHFYFNTSLYLGVRVNYGLIDVTNNDYDISRTTSNGTEPVFRSDKDSNLSLQASLGFSF